MFAAQSVKVASIEVFAAMRYDLFKFIEEMIFGDGLTPHVTHTITFPAKEVPHQGRFAGCDSPDPCGEGSDL